MKKIILLLFGALVGIPAICQTDSMYLYTLGNDSLFFPTELFKKGVVAPGLLNLRLRKAVRQEVAMGMDRAYIPETDVQGGNAPRSKAAVLIYQVPISVQVTQVQLDSISQYIKKITEPPVVQQPDIIQEIDDKPSAAISYMVNATTPFNGVVNQPDWTKWVHFENQTWNAPHLANTASFGYVVNGYLQVSWTGYKIEWYPEKRENHGIAAVSVDGGPEVMVDLYKNTKANGNELAFTWPNVTPANPTNATHTIRIRVTGQKNAAATEFNVSHDYFKAFKRP